MQDLYADIVSIKPDYYARQAAIRDQFAAEWDRSDGSAAAACEITAREEAALAALDREQVIPAPAPAPAPAPVKVTGKYARIIARAVRSVDGASITVMDAGSRVRITCGGAISAAPRLDAIACQVARRGNMIVRVNDAHGAHVDVYRMPAPSYAFTRDGSASISGIL